MECPACKKTLSQRIVDGIELDICRGGCGGIWFDNFEFKKFDKPHDEAGVELLNILIDPTMIVDHSERRPCPKCDEVTLMRHFYSAKHDVEIDECAKCAGVWLDFGELNTIRKPTGSREQRSAVAAAVFDEMFGPKLEKLRQEKERDPAQPRRFANLLKFLCPSYYLAGMPHWEEL